MSAAAAKSKFIKLPPTLNIKPISQKRITKPPNHLKNAILTTPYRSDGYILTLLFDLIFIMMCG